LPVRMTVIGTGHLGLSHAVCMAELGHEVLAVDVDERTVASASRGEMYSPTVEVCERILREGAIASAHDPAAMPNASRVLPGLRHAESVSEAVRDADLVLYLTH
jgi:UDP-glucose 6-dehydrogenase